MVLHEIRKSPELCHTSQGDAVVPFPKMQHKVTAVIRAQAPFLALQ